MITTTIFKSRHWLSAFALTIACTLWSFSGQAPIEENWVLLKSESNVKAYAAEIICDGRDYIAFRLENTGSTASKVEFSYSIPEDPFFGEVTEKLSISEKGMISADCSNLRKLMVPNLNPGNSTLRERINSTLTINK